MVILLWLQEGETDYGWLEPLIKILQLQEVSVVGAVLVLVGLLLIGLMKKDPWVYTRGRHQDVTEDLRSDKLVLEATVKDLTSQLVQAQRDYLVAREQVIRHEERESAWRISVSRREDREAGR